MNISLHINKVSMTTRLLFYASLKFLLINVGGEKIEKKKIKVKLNFLK